MRGQLGAFKKTVAKKKPYRRIKIWYSAKTGKLVGAKFRGKRRFRWGYISLLSGRRISRMAVSSDPNTQGWREAFGTYNRPGYYTRGGRWVPPKRIVRTEKTIRKIKRTFRDFRELRENILDKSPGLERLFVWLQDQPKALQKTVMREVYNGEIEPDDSSGRVSTRKRARAKRRVRPTKPSSRVLRRRVS